LRRKTGRVDQEHFFHLDPKTIATGVLDVAMGLTASIGRMS
jgi:hypothetical protein